MGRKKILIAGLGLVTIQLGYAIDTSSARSIADHLPFHTPVQLKDRYNRNVSGIIQLAWSSDARYAAAMIRNSPRVKLFDVQTGNEIIELIGHTQEITSVRWSPDSTKILTTSSDTTARIWSPENGRSEKILAGHHKRVTYGDWSADQRYIVTTSDDTTACIWNAETGELLHRLAGHTKEVTFAAFNHHSDKLVTASNDKTGRIWQVDSGVSLYELDGVTVGKNKITWFPDDLKILYASSEEDNLIKSFDATPQWHLFRNIERDRQGRGGRLLNVAELSPDGRYVFTVEPSTTKHLWNTATGTRTDVSIRDADNRIYYAQWMPYGTDIIGVCNRRPTKVWSAEDGRILYTLPTDVTAEEVNSIAVNRYGTQVARLYNSTTTITDISAPIIKRYFDQEGLPLKHKSLLVSLYKIFNENRIKGITGIRKEDLTSIVSSPIDLFSDLPPEVQDGLRNVFKIGNEAFNVKKRKYEETQE